MLERVLPIGTKYRPLGAEERSLHYIASQEPGSAELISAHVLYAKYENILEIPAELLNAIPPYYLYDRIERPFGHMPRMETVTDYLIAKIPNGRLVTDNLFTIGVISGAGNLLGDLSYQHSPLSHITAADNGTMDIRWFASPRSYSGTVFSMLSGGGSASNYGHWLIDALPRIHLLQKAGLFDQIDYFLVPAYSASYHKDTLELLGIAAAKVIVAHHRMHIKAELLIATTHPRGNRSMLVPHWLIEWHRASYLHLADISKTYSKRVYISRRDSSLRNVINEDELMARLSANGFVSYRLADLSFREKIALFAQAEFIISASGAGLNTLMYAKPGCKVLEIFPEGMVHAQFYDICAACGLCYQFMVCPPPRQHHANNVREGRSENVIVDMDRFEQVYRSLVEQEAQLATIDQLKPGSQLPTSKEPDISAGDVHPLTSTLRAF
jgi:capsular polysaccharide biosynthesis protein